MARIGKRARIGLMLLAVCVAAIAVTCVLVGTGRLCITSAARPENRSSFDLPAYTSSNDQDGDGVDDQPDILAAALAYVETKPRYKSAYYASGYPDDGYRVCTDVVAVACREAGYDLQELVHEDIAASPETYDVDQPDSAIDFRRVRNLRVFFERNAQTLTCDPARIGEWQGGDIVVFENHIGIVSDRRNASGVPYLIHHASQFQLAYEEDALERYAPVVGHFRLG
ncbi:MAG: DUF1287 domain-containing protein [Coriobacteriaceae bacterium]|nr:DUF1287 domain-containing protein [Coriobacteriaceae bacterium]